MLSGCMQTINRQDVSQYWNIPSTGQSTFDNSKYIRLSNMSCGEIFLDLYQDTNKAKKNIILMQAGVHTIDNIGSNKSLLFKIEGKKYSFKTVSNITEHGKAYYGSNNFMNNDIDYSYKEYIVPESFIKKAANAENMVARLYLLNNTYIDGKCSALTLAEAKAKSGSYADQITEDNINDMNSTIATIGFSRFVKMMRESF